MSSYTMVDLRGQIGIATDTVPLVWEASVDASEISALTVAIVCSSVSAGVNVVNPATVGIEHSFDDGLSWITVAGLNGAVVSGAGTFLTSVSLTSGLIAPLIKVTLTAPAGQSVTITKARKNRFLPGTLISFAGSSFLGGTTVNANLVMKYGPAGVFVDTAVTYDTTTPANTRALPVIGVDASGVHETLTVRRGPAGVFTDTRVALDTTTPANTLPVPVLGVDASGVHETHTIRRGPAGVFADARVTHDTTTPAGTIPMPVLMVDAGGNEFDPDTLLTSTKPEYSSAYAPVSGLGLALVANTWKEFIPITAAKSVKFQYVNESGYAIELGIGTASKVVLAEAGEVDLVIPVGSQIQLRCATSNTLPVFWFSAFA